jgi:DNA-binding MarR family transcriptional regulator
MSQIRKSTTSIKENARKSLEITRDEYALCSYAHYRCADPRMKAGGWCTDTKDEVADFVGISRPGLYKMMDRLEKKGLIEVQAGTGFIRATAFFIDTEHRNECKQSLQRPKSSVNKVDTDCKLSLQGGVNLVTPNIEVEYEYKVNKVNNIVDKGETVNGFSVNGKKQTTEGNLEAALKTEKENIVRGAPAAGADIEKTIEALKENEFVREAFARVSRVPVEKYFEYLEEFKIKCRAEQAKHTNEGDTRKHFLNWARIRYQSESNNQKNTTNANYSKPNRKDPEQARRDAFARTLAILDLKGD